MTTLVVAALALVVGLAGVVLSAIALGRADKAGDLAATANSRVIVAPPAAGATSAPAPAGPADDPTAEPAEPGTTTPADISPTAEFVIAYEGQRLRVRSPDCGNDNTGVDLDEPRVAGQSIYDGVEFGFKGCNPGNIVTKLQVAQVSGPAATPKDCLETIRTDPGRSPIAAKRGLTLCFVTDQTAAAAKGITQKLVFVTVESVTVDNNVGVLNISMKAWNMPQ